MGRSGTGTVVVLVRPKEWEDKNANREPWKNGKPAEEREECTVNRVGIFPQFPANFPAKKASMLEEALVWKFQDFSATQILREINFGEFRSTKTAVFPF